MNTNDISTALQFMLGCDYKYIILQCDKAQDIPYVKRALIKLMGEPRKTIDNSFYYGDKRILMQSASSNVVGIPNENIFYVSYEDESDWNRNVSKVRNIYCLLSNWFDVIDAYNLLIRDGMTGDQALDLVNSACMKVV